MATEAGPLRLTPPNHQMYDTGVGEATILRGLTPDTMGAMYGMLLNQRGLQDTRMGEYQDQLGQVNQQQGVLARAKLAADDLNSQRTAVGNLVQHAGMPSSAALAALRIEGLPSPYTTQGAQAATLAADETQQTALQAKALADAGRGVDAAREAGFATPEGTAVGRGAGGLINAPRVAGAPVALDVARLQAAAKAGRGGSGTGGVTVALRYGDAGETIDNTVTGKNVPVEQVYAAGQRLRGAIEADRAGQVTAAGGNATPGNTRGMGGANAGASGRTNSNATPLPRPGTGNQTPGPLTAEQKRALEPRIGTFVRREQDPRTNRVTIYGTKGSVVQE